MRPMTQAKKTALLYTQIRLKRKHISKTKKDSIFMCPMMQTKKPCIFMCSKRLKKKINKENKKRQHFTIKNV